jgi:hypothetical protein
MRQSENNEIYRMWDYAFNLANLPVNFPLVLSAALALVLFSLKFVIICFATGDSSVEDAGEGGEKKTARERACAFVRMGVFGRGW